MRSDKPIVHVIDDDEAVREVLSFQLGSAGIDVRTYDSAAGFLKTALPVQTGCIVTDVRMPDLSGIDLLRRLRQLKVTAPVIVITAHGDIPLAVEAMGMGRSIFWKSRLRTRYCSPPYGRRWIGRTAIESARPSAARSRGDSQHCRIASVMCCKAWWPDVRISRLRMTSGSALERSRTIEQIL